MGEKADGPGMRGKWKIQSQRLTDGGVSGGLPETLLESPAAVG